MTENKETQELTTVSLLKCQDPYVAQPLSSFENSPMLKETYDETGDYYW